MVKVTIDVRLYYSFQHKIFQFMFVCWFSFALPFVVVIFLFALACISFNVLLCAFCSSIILRHSIQYNISSNTNQYNKDKLYNFQPNRLIITDSLYKDKSKLYSIFHWHHRPPAIMRSNQGLHQSTKLKEITSMTHTHWCIQKLGFYRKSTKFEWKRRRWREMKKKSKFFNCWRISYCSFSIDCFGSASVVCLNLSVFNF